MQENSVKLSIIIPVYNGAETLQECVDAIVSNELTWNYEILLVNDGSTDASEALCKSLQSCWKERIRYVYKENGGSLSARLRGIREARGEYLLFVDCDDILLTQELNSAIESITQPNASLYVFDFLYEHIETGKIQRQQALKNCDANRMFVGDERKPLMDAYLNGALGTMCCCLIRRDVAEKTLFLEKEKKMIVGEDRLQKMFVLICSHSIAYIPQAIYRYLLRPGSQSAPLYAAHIPNPLVLLKDFANCWGYERHNSAKLLQTDAEKLSADLYRMRRTYKLLLDVYEDSQHTAMTKRQLFSLACSEKVLVEIAHGLRKQGKRDLYAYFAAGILKRKSYWQFVLFGKLVKLIRTAKHGRK